MQINGKPRHVFQWHITHACNLRCRHCYQNDYRSSLTPEQMYAILDKYTDFVEKNGYFGQINLTGGEPLLHPEFFALAGEIKRRGFRLGILTNGTLIDRETAQRIERLHPVFVQISLDGTPGQHDRVRGKGAFRKALRGIRLLKARGIRVLVSFTAQKSNLESFGKLARICRLYRVDKLWWDRVVTDCPQDCSELALSTEAFQRFLEKSLRLEEKYRRPDGTCMISNQRSLQFLGCDPWKPGYVCSAGRSLVAVLADGAVMPCRRLPFVIGNVLEADFQHILDSSEVVRTLRSNPYPAECAGCRYLPRCMGGAKCVTYGQTGKLDQKDPNCYLRVSDICGVSPSALEFP